jgi:hypothetical protein
MDFHSIDFDQRATLVRFFAGDDHATVFEGSLRQVLDYTRSIEAADRPAFSIRLPDQTVPPLGFEWVHFDALRTALPSGAC